ncbi:DUF1735 domain-containing protein [Arcicella sp. LKC2W]|uniref:BT_3987 domain-containing protein n=1 Tax=Arcicella sp. LKC2W TaxID=2984198 RepID=UPI002B1F7082|nr:DUF1735 domain-containing protein [Arcicella sp. LKC2W]MEA5460362.1 DUF1735 domain-containing protein [Arcicella sp. LKC2W]
MKRYIKSMKALVLGLVVLATACVPEGKDMIDGIGSNFVRLPAANEELSLLGVDLVAGDKTTEFLEIIRDVNSSSELNNAVSVSLKVDDALITAYNKAHATTFEALPTSLYKLSEVDVKMAAGDFSKNVAITFDPTKLDAKKSYALGISVASAGNYKIRNGLGSALFQIIAKNKWHGKYKALGVFTHPTAGPRDIDRLKDVVTLTPNSVSTELGDLGGAGYTMTLTVNADNSVTVTPTGATPNINQSYSKNYYDPATKSFYLHYSYNVAAPRIVKEVLTLK